MRSDVKTGMNSDAETHTRSHAQTETVKASSHLRLKKSKKWRNVSSAWNTSEIIIYCRFDTAEKFSPWRQRIHSSVDRSLLTLAWWWVTYMEVFGSFRYFEPNHSTTSQTDSFLGHLGAQSDVCKTAGGVQHYCELAQPITNLIGRSSIILVCRVP